MNLQVLIVKSQLKSQLLIIESIIIIINHVRILYLHNIHPAMMTLISGKVQNVYIHHVVNQIVNESNVYNYQTTTKIVISTYPTNQIQIIIPMMFLTQKVMITIVNLEQNKTNVTILVIIIKIMAKNNNEMMNQVMMSRL